MAGLVVKPYSIFTGCSTSWRRSRRRSSITGGSVSLATRRSSVVLLAACAGILGSKQGLDFAGAQSASMSVSASAAAGSSAADSSEAKWEQAIKKAKFGKPIVIEPKGKHLASIVWLHGLGDTGHGWASTLEILPFKNIRWIVPTAPVRPVTVNNGYPCTAWFDVGSLSDQGPDDVIGLDTSAAFVASLLSKEPADVKLAVGGFSMGGATSLYVATHSVLGKYTDGTPFTRKIDAAISLSGWLPAGKLLPKQVAENPNCKTRAAEIPIFMGHGTDDFIVMYHFGEMSAKALRDCGFTNITFKSYKGLDHSSSNQELDDIQKWIKKELSLTD